MKPRPVLPPRPFWPGALVLSLRGQFANPWSTAMTTLAQFLIPLTVLAGIRLMFARFGSLAGYTAAQAVLLFGVTQVAFSMAEMLARGFDTFSQILAQGEFDRMLVRPRALVVQVLAARVEVTRTGRFVTGLCCLALSAPLALPAWGDGGLTALRIVTLALMVAGGSAIFFGIFALGAAFAFRSTDSLELVNILSDGGREASQYPLTIYDEWFRRFFTFVVPFGCVNWLPLEFVLGRPGAEPWVAVLPLAGFGFAGFGILVWYRGVQHYVSTGS